MKGSFEITKGLILVSKSDSKFILECTGKTGSTFISYSKLTTIKTFEAKIIGSSIKSRIGVTKDSFIKNCFKIKEK